MNMPNLGYLERKRCHVFISTANENRMWAPRGKTKCVVRSYICHKNGQFSEVQKQFSKWRAIASWREAFLRWHQTQTHGHWPGDVARSFFRSQESNRCKFQNLVIRLSPLSLKSPGLLLTWKKKGKNNTPPPKRKECSLSVPTRNVSLHRQDFTNGSHLSSAQKPMIISSLHCLVTRSRFRSWLLKIPNVPDWCNARTHQPTIKGSSEM